MASTEIASFRFNKQKRSGYEPSDTETDWQDDQISGVFVPAHNSNLDFDLPRNNNDNNRSPLRLARKLSLKFDGSDSPQKEPTWRSRHSSKSPYKTRKEDVHVRTVSPISVRRNVSPFSKSEHRRQVSPFKPGREGDGNRRRNQRTPNREERASFSQFGEVSRASERSSHTRRSVTAPRQRIREKEQENNQDFSDNIGERTTPSRTLSNKQREHTKSPSVGEINEMVANMKFPMTPTNTNAPYLESTDSISPSDIFFSRDHTAFVTKRNGTADKTNLVPRPPRYSSQMESENGRNERNPPRILMNSSSRSTMISSSAVSGKSNGKFSIESGKTSDTSRTSLSSKRFTENRKKSQAESWFSCMRRGSCRTSRSPEKQCFDEASFIERAFVVETLREFWADKHQPISLNGFICHKQEAQLLKELASHNNIPHILLKGAPGSGKRSLARAFLCEIFDKTCRNISHDLRYFQVQEQRAMQVAVQMTSSAHHIELNLDSEPNAKYALMGLVKEISSTYAIVPEVSTVTFKPDYKVLVLYQVDKAAENVQHLIKWIMDCYTDACKLIICCEDDVDILESVTNRCKVVKIDAPVTHEIMEVLIQIARKEDFDLPMNFAARIAAKSKQNLRRAIMTLEACKAHNYPFADDQPIPSGWEEILVELASDILTDPSQKRLFLVRGKFQKLLADFVHPKLILLKLVEQFLQGVDASSRRELYYWHAYYDKRMPAGSSALLKLEEFVAKFMGMHRTSLTGR